MKKPRVTLFQIDNKELKANNIALTNELISLKLHYEAERNRLDKLINTNFNNSIK